MNCKKTKFDSMDSANSRSMEINSKNAKSKHQKEQLRPYKCKDCDGFHLTKMTKHMFKVTADVDYRTKVRESNFIQQNSEHYERMFSQV